MGEGVEGGGGVGGGEWGRGVEGWKEVKSIGEEWKGLGYGRRGVG